MTFTGPYVDTSATYGADSAGPVEVGAPFLDSGAGFAGLILNSDGAQLRVAGSVFESYRNLSYRDPRDDAGSFSFDVPRDLFTGIAFDDIVEVQLDGQSIFAGVIEGITHAVYNSDETPMVTVSGRSMAALFDQAVVYPSRGVGALPIEDVRSFSWVAPDFDDSSWPLAKRINRQREYADFRSPVPSIWPDTQAWWIWANIPAATSEQAPVGTCLFRQSFVLADPETVKFFCAGDNLLDFYVDGAEMSTGGEFVTGRFITIPLSAGTHYVAASVENLVRVGPGTGPNPGGFLLAAYTVADNGLLGDLILDTDADWSCLPYPDVNPGFTHGQVIREIVEESQADDALTGITLDFDDTVDTSGQAWGQYREITCQVGRTVLEMLGEMATFIEFEVTANKVLRAWTRGNRGITRTATLQQTASPVTSDFVSLTHNGKRTRLNRSLIRYGGGHLEELDTGSVAANDSRGGYLALGAIRGEPEARRIAQSLMETRAAEAYSTGAELRPASDLTTPYKAFGLADYITCPDHTDTPVEMQVQAVTFRQDDDNATVAWVVEMNDPELIAEERMANWLNRMADGALMGGARVSSPIGTPAPSAADLVSLRAPEFSFDNAQLTVSASPVRAFEVSGNVVEVYGELTTAGSTTTEVQIRWGPNVVSGVVHIDDAVISYLTFPAGTEVVEIPIAVIPVTANRTKAQCIITTAGTGAAGLDVQIRVI